MAHTYHEIEAEALGLKADERALLLERLIQSFEPGNAIEAAWVSEALRRRQKILDGKAATLSGETFLSGLKDRLG